MTPDVSLLVAASRSDHPHHGPALPGWVPRWMIVKGAVRWRFIRWSRRDFCGCSPTQVFVQPAPAEAALAFLRAVLNSPGVEIPRLGGEWPVFERLCERHRLSGNDIPDAGLLPPCWPITVTW